MIVVNIQDIRLAFGGPEIFSGVTMQISRGERVCLLGRNGAGKSTLMKIISGELTPDTGQVIRGQEVRIASMTQEVPRDMSGTVFEYVSGGLGSLVDLLSEYHRVSTSLAKEHNESLIGELERIQHEIESSGGWDLQQKVDTVISRLKLDPDADASSLSGGNKRRVLLARALVNEPDLLLLDEPTNHLDIDSITWLEECLLEFRGAILFITHDRRFLRNLATRIVELDRGMITDWSCDYPAYLKRRQAELDAEATQNALFDKKLAQEEVWIRQGIRARRTRNEGRVRALIKMRENRANRREQAGSAKIALNEAERSGKLVIEAKEINLAYEGRPLIRDFSTTVMRGDRIGIIGPNGSGKTTLIRVLLGLMKPDSGSVKLGTKLETAYFDQHRAELDESKSVIDNISSADQVTIDGRSKHIISYLRDFLFTPDRVRLPVKVLSGGERNRALLARLFTQPSNVLVMDEPTNDLDSDTLELLEEMLMDFSGTLLLVSHDREFLNNIVTSTIACEGEGRLKEYVGGYDDWLRQRVIDEPKSTPKKTGQKKPKAKKQGPRTLTFKEKRELESLPERIETLELENNGLYESLADPEVYKEGGDRVAEAKARIEELEVEIAAAYERWDLLESIGRESG